MKVVRYKSTDKTYEHPVTVFKGEFQECMDYYLENKSKERMKGNYLEIRY